MLNNVSLVAKIHSIEVNSGNNKFLLLDVERPFKNNMGNYEIDIIRCILWTGIAETIDRYYQPGDVVSISGRLESAKDHYSLIVAEKVDFLVKRRKPDDHK
jgi:single-strand DNA-binding protein